MDEIVNPSAIHFSINFISIVCICCVPELQEICTKLIFHTFNDPLDTRVVPPLKINVYLVHKQPNTKGLRNSQFNIKLTSKHRNFRFFNPHSSVFLQPSYKEILYRNV